jgi:hypothetical protein
MKIDCDKISTIKASFPGAAWAYAESLDSVRIGKWDGCGFVFYEPLTCEMADKYLLELRVFDERRELKFTGDKCRDTDNYEDSAFIGELAYARYYMYGEHCVWRDGSAPEVGFTPLLEDRGGTVYFPAKITFKKDSKGNAQVALKLGIKNFVRHNPVPVLRAGEEYGSGLGTSGAGMLEVVDFAYTGFFYEDGKAVEI